MAELVLSKRDTSTGTLQYMSRETVETIIEKLSHTVDKKMFLHADWTAPPEYSEWLFSHLAEKGFETTACTHTIDALPFIKHMQGKVDIIELCLERKGKIEKKKGSAAIRTPKFFLIVDTISKDGSLYEDILETIPPSSLVTLGINWQSRLSGPSIFKEEDSSSWAATVMAIVEKLSAQKSSTELACGIKLCMFNRQQLGILPTKLIKWPLARCQTSFFFDINGNLQPCMRLSLPKNLSFNHLSDLQEVSKSFLEWLEPYSGHCLDAEDLNCRSHKVGCCSTGCIEHTVNEWQSS